MPRSERARRWLKFGVAVGVSVVFVALFVGSVDIDEVGQALADANYVYVAPALALFAASVGIRALRWRYFLLPSQDLSWRQLLPSVLIGYAGNNLLPLRAGELVRAQHLADRFGVPRMQTFGAVLMERLFDGLALAVFLLWGLLLVDVGTAYLGLGLAMAGAALMGLAIGVLLAREPALPERIAALNLPFFTPRIRKEVAGLGGSFLGGFSVLARPSLFAMATLSSAAAWGLELSMYWLIGEAFNLDASFISVAFAGAAANVSLSLPSAQGGVGPFEVFATEALLKFDIAETAAAAYALALHFFLIVPVSLVGLVVLWRTTLPGAERAGSMAAPALEPNE